MTVGYHAPPGGAKTGVADYAWTLLDALQQRGTVIPDAREASVHLYHLGNNRLHEEIYAKSLRTPGAILLHDAVLHHFHLGTLTEEQYLREWTHNYGEWRIDLGRELWRNRARSAVDERYFRFPMLRRAVERAKLVLVHNPGAAAMAKAHGAERVVVVPHFVQRGRHFAPAAILKFRSSLGVPADAILFGIFGFLRETKRLLPCLRTFHRLHALRPNTRLLISGECESRELARLLQSEADHPAVLRTGHLPTDQFDLATAAVDCCLNLRFPAAGETSGIAVRLMGHGRPVVLSESLENSAFPPASCIRVACGIAEEAELFEYMGLVVDFPRVARQIGERAARHMRETHSLESAASQIWNVLAVEASCKSSAQFVQ